MVTSDLLSATRFAWLGSNKPNQIASSFQLPSEALLQQTRAHDPRILHTCPKGHSPEHAQTRSGTEKLLGLPLNLLRTRSGTGSASQLQPHINQELLRLRIKTRQAT